MGARECWLAREYESERERCIVVKQHYAFVK
jgi:hypothetical protein